MADYLYIHIPFCIRKCLYCDFLSVSYDQVLAGNYIDAACREIAMRKDRLGMLKSLYIGGGTPSLLDLRCHEKLFSCLHENAAFDDGAEITLEANPAAVTYENLKSLSGSGVNRISLGVQSFHDPELSALGRSHTADDARIAVEMIGAAGLGNLSIDLIYGIPGQTMETWVHTLHQALESIPRHISAYELTPEEKTPLMEAILSGKVRLPEEDTVIGMYDAAIETLGRHGYEQYEISNFAQPGFACKHNLNYWNRGEYTGIGAGAHSFYGNIRTSNERDIMKYIEETTKGVMAAAEETLITPAEAVRELIFLGLRKREGISAEETSRSGIDLVSSCGEFFRDGFLEQLAGRIRLTRKGLLISNTVMVKVFERLGL